MARRRYSAVSNYSIGQFVRMLFGFVVGFGLTEIILPRLGIVHTRDELLIASMVVGVLLALVAKRHT